MNIILIGMRGAGKSTIGKILAKRLNKDFLDLDILLEKKLRMNISEIVKKYGWTYFREQEAIVVKELTKKNVVIATGGGIVLKNENINILRKNAIFIYLKTSIYELSKRIKESDSRPSLLGEKNVKEELGDVLRQRKKIYENVTDLIIVTNKLNEEEVVNQILKKFKNLFIIIGDPIEHTLSPKMHNAAYKALGIDDKFNYIKCRVEVSELKDFIKDIRQLGVKGICCTIPHKVEVMKYIDQIDDVAKKIGAVNTIVNNNGVLRGFNTDWIGVLAPLEKVVSLENKNVAILGAGGAARAVVFAISKKNIKFKIYNRTFENAQTLVDEFGGDALSFEDLNNIKNADIIINTTSVGLHRDESPLDKKYISKLQIVFDLVYLKSGDTKLIKDAKKRNAKTISGIEMLLHQGYEQFKIFTGYDAPEKIMRKAIL